MPAEPQPVAPELIEAVRAAVAEAVAVPQLLTTASAMRYVGLSKSGFHRAKSAGLLPKPVHVEGSGDRYRRADLDRWLAALKPARRASHVRPEGRGEHEA